jgi:transposase
MASGEESAMARKSYPEQFKQSAVDLVIHQNYKPQEAARSLGVPLVTIKYWLQRYRRRNGVVDAQEEKDLKKRVVELEKENARLRIERDILKKAAAWFAKEQL